MSLRVVWSANYKIFNPSGQNNVPSPSSELHWATLSSSLQGESATRIKRNGDNGSLCLMSLLHMIQFPILPLILATNFEEERILLIH